MKGKLNYLTTYPTAHQLQNVFYLIFIGLLAHYYY